MKRNHLTFFVLLLPFFVFAQHNSSDAVLGIRTSHVSNVKAEFLDFDTPYGSYVTRVYENSAAEKLNLQVFDYIYQINDDKVSKGNSLSNLLNRYQPGEVVNVKYIRNGIESEGSIALSDEDDIERRHLTSEEDPFLGISPIHESMPKGVKGAIISPVSNSTAFAMGVQRGDVITAIDDVPMYNYDDIHAAIDNRKVGDDIKLTIYRDGEYIDFQRPIKSLAATHNDHSRGHGVNVIEGASEDAPDSEISVNPIAIEEMPDSPEIELPQTQETEATNNKSTQPASFVQNFEVEQLKVFPNPTTGIIDINFTLPQEGRTAIRIFDATGRVVYENNLGNFQGTFSDRIDI
ncbi:MAG: PDZ domain-containing protein, partial [Bacteroidota bacterium]